MSELETIDQRAPEPGPVYLGDAVYASFDGYHIWLHLNVTARGIMPLTSNGWSTIVREVSEFWGDKRPVKCADDPERIHYMLSC